MTEKTVWIVGDWRHVDSAASVAWLNATVRCVCFDDVDAALVDLRRTEAVNDPGTILLVEPRPGMIGEHDVERLHAAAPLARLVALIGPWCEGEARSGRPWPGVIRVPWRSWRSRLPGELGLGSFSPVRLPRTATDTERLAVGLLGLGRRRARSITVSIRTTDRAAYESLQDALRVLGMAALWQPTEADESAHGATLIDGWENVAEPCLRTTPRVLLLAFPRPEDVQRA